MFALIFSRVSVSQSAKTGLDNFEFRVVDVFIDPKGKPLAAYQLDWRAISGNAKIVGIEGGEHPAFRNPPYYDPKAIQQERVIVAAFNVNEESGLPKRRTRVATIHLRTKAGARCEYRVGKAEGATTDGRRISIETTSVERINP